MNTHQRHQFTLFYNENINSMLFRCYHVSMKKSVDMFFYKMNFYKKMSVKNTKTLRKGLENLQPQISELQF